MNKCTILGHKWDAWGTRRVSGHIFKQHAIGKSATWSCERCGIETEDYIQPPRWPWFYKHSL